MLLLPVQINTTILYTTVGSSCLFHPQSQSASLAPHPVLLNQQGYSKAIYDCHATLSCGPIVLMQKEYQYNVRGNIAEPATIAFMVTKIQIVATRWVSSSTMGLPPFSYIGICENPNLGRHALNSRNNLEIMRELQVLINEGLYRFCSNCLVSKDTYCSENIFSFAYKKNGGTDVHAWDVDKSSASSLLRRECSNTK